MNHYEANTIHGRIKRVTKQNAIKAFNQGETIGLCPAKLSPVAFQSAFLCPVSKAMDMQDCVHSPTPEDPYRHIHVPRSFDNIIRDFKSYNCNSNETGNYVAFYLITSNKEGN